MKRFTIFLLWALSMQVSMIMAQSASGSIAGHEYVDLGLSVKWATCNLGASSPSDCGDYYAWGETSTKSSYTEKNNKTCGKKIADISGKVKYDVARAKWGGKWRIPTKAEMEELKCQCTWTWATQDGSDGYEITGKNGNSIFLPAAGWRDGKKLDYDGKFGCYWCSTPHEKDAQSSYNLYFASYCHISVSSYRLNGFSLRPVTEL